MRTRLGEFKRCCTVPRIAGRYVTARIIPRTGYYLGSDGSQGHGWKKELDEESKGVEGLHRARDKN